MRGAHLIICFFLFCFITTGGFCQEIVFQGVPIVKNSSSHKKTANETLSKSQQMTDKLVIAREGKQYYWYSRDKKTLEYKKNGSFHYFYDPQGASYIKIFKAEEGKYLYLEHISVGFNTTTYWGGGNELDL